MAIEFGCHISIFLKITHLSNVVCMCVFNFLKTQIQFPQDCNHGRP
jgi:hypothetical protein